MNNQRVGDVSDVVLKVRSTEQVTEMPDSKYPFSTHLQNKSTNFHRAILAHVLFMVSLAA